MSCAGSLPCFNLASTLSNSLERLNGKERGRKGWSVVGRGCVREIDGSEGKMSGRPRLRFGWRLAAGTHARSLATRVDSTRRQGSGLLDSTQRIIRPPGRTQRRHETRKKARVSSNKGSHLHHITTTHIATHHYVVPSRAPYLRPDAVPCPHPRRPGTSSSSRRCHHDPSIEIRWRDTSSFLCTIPSPSCSAFWPRCGSGPRLLVLCVGRHTLLCSQIRYAGA